MVKVTHNKLRKQHHAQSNIRGKKISVAGHPTAAARMMKNSQSAD